ncbi:TfuA-like protein [Amycolatopsis sp. A133]|uniref:TfuA-like protein n=1 Tax=Amycolatopsis sp. A133 TaxID=3064472 RepID=UPI0027EEFD4A|nr:TfuA-like protein [Amycolatopsis sp. A133]MDQ7807518.1 TfuA-like protein [Amycolatopsis sp. A133]
MATGTVHLYVGPTCSAVEVRRRFPDVVVHPPASHGDFFAADLVSGDVAVVVDGYYHHRLGLRHKEYLYALDRGVTVLGAASIGALRARELSAFGMRGSGAVYELYRAGVFDGDDAVAVAHEDSAPYTSLSVPLVNLYAAAQAACAAGVLRSEDVDEVIAALRAEYYPLRTEARVVRILRRAGRAELADWYEERTAADPHVFDQKRRDCLDAVEAARHLVADGAVGQVTGSGGADWKTVFLRVWSNSFAERTGDPPLGHRLAYQQIFSSGYPRAWERYLDETYRRRRPAPAGEAVGDLAESLSRQIGVARFPQPVTHKEDWLFDFVCPVPDLSDPGEVELLLSTEEPGDVETVARYLRQLREFTGRGSGFAVGDDPEVLSGDAAKVLLCHLWEVPPAKLVRECRRRGIPNVRTAIRILQPFVVGAIKDRKYTRVGPA